MDVIPPEAKEVICIELGDYANNMYPAFAHDESVDSENVLILSTLKELYDKNPKDYDFKDWYPEIKTLFEQANKFDLNLSECVGCTDSDAYNYDPSVQEDDGSCKPKVFGCTNNEAFNYDESANTDNGSCLMPDEVIYGCTDDKACNYDSNANQNDDTCILITAKLQNIVGNNYNNIIGNYVFCAEDNEAIQEKDTDNKIHNLKFAIEDPEMYIHIHKYQNELYNKEFTLDGSKLKFMHQTGDNKKNTN